MEPFRALLKPKIPFWWDGHMDVIFAESKETIIREIEKGVTIFDKSKMTYISPDWSTKGVGFWLSQKHCDCDSRSPQCCRDRWKIVLAGSRFLNPAEANYAPIEGEALAVVYSLDKAKNFVQGCENLIVVTDHQPLLKVFGDRKLEDIANGRLLKLKEKTLRYRFQIVHVPGR